MTTHADTIRSYASSFHDDLTGHHVASPLGVWLLLALLGPAATPEKAPELERILGMEVHEAAGVARRMLESPHEAVRSAVASWVQEGKRTARLAKWEAALPEAVERGGMPTQREADSWARERTLGLIEEFPLEITSDMLFVLTSALATKVRWEEAFELVSGERLGDRWRGEVRSALLSASSHECLIVPSAVGDLGVHLARSGDGLLVASGIAETKVGSAEVLRALHQVAFDAARSELKARSLFDLPVGEGHAWTLSEERVMGPRERAEQVRAVLPAWTASNTHELLSLRSSGASEGLEVMKGLLDPDPEGLGSEAVQVAVASYGREGFEAAAVTAFGVPRAAAPMPSREMVLRRAEVRFGRAYGVVAVALDSAWDASLGREMNGPWHGVPVFSAWVEEPSEAE